MCFWVERSGAVIGIIDYGAGNLRSVKMALDRLGAPSAVTADPVLLLKADGLILPGVGAFADAMGALERSGVLPALFQAVEAGKPLLGICLGMQLLLDGSEEGPGVKGLGLIPGMVRRLPDKGLKIPHMGWNSLTPVKSSPILAGLPAEPYVYFVHSYACEAERPEDVLTVTEYGVPFHSAVQRDNLIGLQFHPEKSGKTGRRMLENFVEMTRGWTHVR